MSRTVKRGPWRAGPVRTVRGTVSIDHDQTVGTTSITPIDRSRARLRYLGCTCTTGNLVAARGNARISLSATLVTATRHEAHTGGAGTGVLVVSFEIEIYPPGEVRVVEGTVASQSSTTVRQHNPARSELDFLGFSSNDTNPNANQVAITPRLSMASSTSVASADGGGTNTSTSSFQITEYLR
jgi:hypothetical protein